MSVPSKLKVYIGCALTTSPVSFQREVEELKARLKAGGVDVLDFIGLTAGTAAEVYKWDIGHCIAACDKFVAVCDYPAIGLGFELSAALARKKPTLVVAHKQSKVSRLVLGLAESEPTIDMFTYDSLLGDGHKQIDSWLKANPASG